MSELITALYVTLFIICIIGGLKSLLAEFIMKIDGGYNEKLGGFLIKPGLYFFQGMGFIIKYSIVWGVITLILMYTK
jgi:hypothetical protein